MSSMRSPRLGGLELPTHRTGVVNNPDSSDITEHHNNHFSNRYTSPPPDAFPKAVPRTPITAPATIEPPTVYRSNASRANSPAAILLVGTSTKVETIDLPAKKIHNSSAMRHTDPQVVRTAAGIAPDNTTQERPHTQPRPRDHYYDFTDQYNNDAESHFSTSSENIDDEENNNSNDEEKQEASSELAKQQAQRDRLRKRHRNLLLISNAAFVLGSILYLALAVEDWKWGRQAQNIPLSVLQADDDATWLEWRANVTQAQNPNVTQNATVSQSQKQAKGQQSDIGNRRILSLSSIEDAAHGLLGNPEQDDDEIGDNEVELEREFEDDDDDDDEADYVSLDEYTAEDDGDDVYYYYDDDDANATDDDAYYYYEENFANATANDGGLEEMEVAEEAEEQMAATADDDETEERRLREEDGSVLNTAISLLRASEEEGVDIISNHEDDYYIDDYVYLTAQALDKAMADERAQGQQDRRNLQPARIAAIQALWWNQMTLPIQQAAQILGYNQNLWDTRAASFLMTVTWNQLSVTQQDAATVLGYSAETWVPDVDDFDWADSASSSNNASNVILEPKPQPTLVWSNYSWEALPDTTRKAAETLGYNSSLWNMDLAPLLVTALHPAPGWSELSNSQKQAASVLGYTQDTWWYLQNAGSQSSSTTFAAPTVQLQDWHAQYKWQELPSMTRAAFQVLGFTDKIWQQGSESPTDRLTWWQLTAVQREAAASLGYTQALWNARFQNPPDQLIVHGDNPISNGGPLLPESHGAVSETEMDDDLTPSTNPVSWETYDWNELPVDIQQAYAVLGWDENRWDNDDPPESENQFWDALTGDQQLAANYLGYTLDLWNGSGGGGKKIQSNSSADGGGGSSNGTSTKPVVVWDKYGWNELPDNIRQAYETLGYTQDTWDNGGNVHTDALSWQQLSDNERGAASSIGYSEALWNVHSLRDQYSDDDYVFFVPSTNTWVSRYMMIYFAAALCFCVMGVVDLIRERRKFHVCMVLAGVFGLISSMLVETNEVATNVFNLLSVHFFLLEGVNIIRFRIQTLSRQRENPSAHRYNSKLALPSATEAAKPLWWIPKTLWLADLLFVLGALLDVILSYCYFQPSSEYDWTLAKVSLLSAVLWLIAALLSSTVTLALQCCYHDEAVKRAVFGKDAHGLQSGTMKDDEDPDDDATASILPNPELPATQNQGRPVCIPVGLVNALSPTETIETVGSSASSVAAKASAYDLENISPPSKRRPKIQTDLSSTQDL